VIAALFFRFAPRPRSVVARELRSPGMGLHLLQGPVARLAFVALCANVATLTFTSAVPVWLVSERGLAADSPIIGWTLATFASAAAMGGIAGGIRARRLPRSALVGGSLALSLVALQSVLVVAPGSPAYFVAVAAAGALSYLHAPLVIVGAQELAPGAQSAVAGLLLGGTAAAAGVIYAGLGVAQTAFGVGGTLSAAFFVVLPAAYVAAGALRALDGTRDAEAPCSCTMSRCATAARSV